MAPNQTAQSENNTAPTNAINTTENDNKQIHYHQSEKLNQSQDTDFYYQQDTKRMDRKYKIYKALLLISYISIYGAVGGTLGILGPALPSLSTQVLGREEGETDGNGFGKMGMTFTGRAGGWLIGSVVGGIILDKVSHMSIGNKLVALLLLISGASTASIPFCKTLLELVLVLLFQGLASGACEAMINTLVVWFFGRKATTPLQAVHLGFGFGAFISPLLVALALRTTGSIHLSFWIMGLCCLVIIVIPLFLKTPEPQGAPEEQKTPKVISGTPQFPTYTRFEDPNTAMRKRSLDSGVHLTALREPTEQDKSGLMYRERFGDSHPEEPHPSNQDHDDRDQNVESENPSEPLLTESQKHSPGYGSDNTTPGTEGNIQRASTEKRKPRWSRRLSQSRTRSLSLESIRSYFKHMKKRLTLGSLLVFIDVLFLFLGIGYEVAFGGWISFYALSLEITSEQGAATLSSVFWAALTLGRLIGVPLSAVLNTVQMLLIDLGLAILSAALLAIFPRSFIGIWIITATTGLGVSTLYPTAIALPGTFGIKITGRGTSLLIVGACLGEVVIPFVIGPIFQYFGSISLRWITLTISLLGLGTLTILWLIGKEILRACNIGTIAKDLRQPTTKRNYHDSGNYC